MAYERKAYDYRVYKSTRGSTASDRAAFNQGGKNIAYVVDPANSQVFVSQTQDSGGHSEIQISSSITNVKIIFSERQACAACVQQLQQTYPAGTKILVYYVIPYITPQQGLDTTVSPPVSYSTWQMETNLVAAYKTAYSDTVLTYPTKSPN